MNILRFLQQADRRILYALLILAVTLPFFLKLRIPVPISNETKKLYDAIEALPEGSFVLFGSDWSAGTRGENGAQTEALMRHLMIKKLRFAILCFDPQSKTLAQNIAERLQKEYADKYGTKEGTTWVNFGYKVDMKNYLKAFVLDIKKQVGTDIHGTPLEQLPVMKGITTAKDLSFLIDVTPSNTYDTYVQFLQGPYKDNLKMGMAPTAVMAPEAFNYLDSGQIVGMLTGLKGAVEYEQLLNVIGKATKASIALSFAHFLVILFIILGNVAMFLERRQARMGGAA